MTKIKTSSSAKKRFKLTSGVKVMRRHAMKSHNLTKKTSKRKRGFRKDEAVAAVDVPAVRQMLGKRGKR